MVTTRILKNIHRIWHLLKKNFPKLIIICRYEMQTFTVGYSMSTISIASAFLDPIIIFCENNP